MVPAKGLFHGKGMIHGVLGAPADVGHLVFPWIGVIGQIQRGGYTSSNFAIGPTPRKRSLVCFSLGPLECRPVVPVHKTKKAQSRMNLIQASFL